MEAMLKAFRLSSDESALVKLYLGTWSSWQLKSEVGIDTNFGLVTQFLSLAAPFDVLRLESSWMKCPESSSSTWLREDFR